MSASCTTIPGEYHRYSNAWCVAAVEVVEVRDLLDPFPVAVDGRPPLLKPITLPAHSLRGEPSCQHRGEGSDPHLFDSDDSVKKLLALGLVPAEG